MSAYVTAVCSSESHTFSKMPRERIVLLAGRGVEGDAHCGQEVQHLSRVARNAAQPNLRQVHLIHSELHFELNAAGFDVAAGQMGENITTSGIDLLTLPSGTRLHLGDQAVVQVTGVRNPCLQLDKFRKGLMAAVLVRDKAGNLVRKAGIMSVVEVGGEVRPGDPIRIELPPEPHLALKPI